MLARGPASKQSAHLRSESEGWRLLTRRFEQSASDRSAAAGPPDQLAVWRCQGPACTRRFHRRHQQSGIEHGEVRFDFNNAGIADENNALDVTNEIWASVLSVDLKGTFVACREFGRYFVQQGRGSIVNISSIAAFMGTNPEYDVDYDVAKAGVSQLVRSLAVEWAQYGVRVNAVAPGRTRTPILDGVGLSDPTRMQQWIDQIPQRRLLSPEEIAEAVFFLGQERSSAVTGQTLIVDGGQLAA
jgi:NAD(P)-dependent dehydrogenase (short-subunit alcohol dehydrogenase family)